MVYQTEKQGKKLVIGISIRTDNEKCLKDIPEHWGKWMQEQIFEKIPNKINDDVLALYTKYEGDYTKPYTFMLGYEVSTLERIPEGLEGIVIPASPYAVFTSKGPFPQSLGETWQTIWKTPLLRTYATDFEIYPPHFNPQTKPEVKVYIGLNSSTGATGTNCETSGILKSGG